MRLGITLKDVRELNKILTMLNSPDEEANILGYELLKTNELIREHMYDMYYIPKEGKEIPVSWYFRKAEQLKAENESHKDKFPAAYWLLPKSMLESILRGESSKFKAHVSFTFEDSEC